VKPQLQQKSPVWEKLIAVGLYLAFFVFLAGLGYLAYLLLGGKLAEEAYPSAAALTAANAALNSALLLFGIGLWCFVMLGLLQWRTAGLFGWLLLIFGMLSYFAAPLLLNLVPGLDLKGLASPGRNLLGILQGHGGGLICLGAIRIILGMIWWQFSPPDLTAEIPTREAAKGAATSLMRNCWELGFCKNVLKQHCPRFLKKIACWKAHSGCYCDDNLSRTLMVSARSLQEGDAPLETQRSVQRARQSASFLASSRGSAGKRPVCVTCPIYQDHQRYKYRLIAWLMYPLTGAITWLLAPYIRLTWKSMETGLSTLMGYAQVLPTGAKDVAPAIGATLDFSWVAVIFVAAITLSLLMRFSEWLVLDRGL
jgi:hypothetical protein